MDFAGELKERKNLYCQPKKNMMFTSDDAAEAEIMTLKNNQKTLKEIDCGFEVDNYIQIPVPCVSVRDRSCMFLRKFTCRFFSDTDKKYRYEKKERRKKTYTIQYYENYRETNKNNFFFDTFFTGSRSVKKRPPFRTAVFVTLHLYDFYALYAHFAHTPIRTGVSQDSRTPATSALRLQSLFRAAYSHARDSRLSAL